MTFTVRILAVALPLLLLPAVASAQVSTEDRATARQLAKEGNDALEKGDFPTAADRFTRADGLVHAPTLMLGRARAQVGLGKWVVALDLYGRILREGVAAGAPPPFLQALKDARKELTELEPRVPGVIIEVKGAAETVTLDGAVVRPAQLGVKRPVDPGKHLIRAEASGAAPVEAEVTVAERHVETVTLEMALRSPAGGPSAAPVDAGRHPGGARRSVGVAALSLGGAGIVMGAVTGVLALGKRSHLASVCPVPTRCTDGAIGAYDTLGALSTAGFIGGGALAITGIVLLATAPREKAATGATVVPLLGLGWAGAEGSF